MVPGVVRAYVIQPFDAKDLMPVMRIASRVLPESYPFEFFLQMARSSGHFFRIAKHVESGQAVGFIVAARRPGLASSVLLFGVDDAHQGHGVGRALLRDVQRHLVLDNVKSLDLEVRTDNLRAIEFYRREGFAVSGVHERVYKDGSDALSMFKPLW